MKKGVSIHITGIVQGVGFRPWVWKAATERNLSGSVCNGFDGVHIELFGEVDSFLEELENNPPTLSKIKTIRMEEIPFSPTGEFRIVESRSGGEALQQISPDISICDDCRREMFDPDDRRFRYPFINCVNCGPRFSIIEDLPYDRPQTSMREFKMCSECSAEYSDPSDRRYHAQPIACPVCGPRMEPADWESVWKDSMERGKIVAVKGIGGFHLACDARNIDAVARLRRKKGREAKPFALMVPDLEWIKTVCELSAIEEKLLQSRERPIVLLRLKGNFPGLQDIAPGLDTLGIMLPYTPMHEIMFQQFPHPIIMTSANYTSEPMIHTNMAAQKKLAEIADQFLFHNREIVNRCDDSVCAVHGGQIITLRPGRGVAPVSMSMDSDRCILAFGADMKNTFALLHHGQATLHPYVGDLENPDAQRILEEAVEKELKCFNVRPERIIHDLHPDYFSTLIAQKFAKQNKLPSVGIQHHHAHLAATMAEHDLRGACIGFAFDGTGYGTDGTIWGGEVLLCNQKTFSREFHLRAFALPGGDASVRDPQRIADALLYQVDPTRLEASSTLPLLESGINCPATSSMGRLFDAVSCLLDVCRKPTFDGEAAMRLEAIADRQETGVFAFEINDCEIDWRSMIANLLEEQGKGISASVLAARFHNTLAEIVFRCGRRLAEEHGGLPWIFAGGVFQNRLLVEHIRGLAGKEFSLFFSSYPNDSGIPLGQIFVGSSQ